MALMKMMFAAEFEVLGWDHMILRAMKMARWIVTRVVFSYLLYSVGYNNVFLQLLD